MQGNFLWKALKRKCQLEKKLQVRNVNYRDVEPEKKNAQPFQLFLLTAGKSMGRLLAIVMPVCSSCFINLPMKYETRD